MTEKNIHNSDERAIEKKRKKKHTASEVMKLYFLSFGDCFNSHDMAPPPKKKTITAYFFRFASLSSLGLRAYQLPQKKTLQMKYCVYETMTKYRVNEEDGEQLKTIERI